MPGRVLRQHPRVAQRAGPSSAIILLNLINKMKTGHNLMFIFSNSCIFFIMVIRERLSTTLYSHQTSFFNFVQILLSHERVTDNSLTRRVHKNSKEGKPGCTGGAAEISSNADFGDAEAGETGD